MTQQHSNTESIQYIEAYVKSFKHLTGCEFIHPESHVSGSDLLSTTRTNFILQVAAKDAARSAGFNDGIYL